MFRHTIFTCITFSGTFSFLTYMKSNYIMLLIINVIIKNSIAHREILFISNNLFLIDVFMLQEVLQFGINNKLKHTRNYSTTNKICINTKRPNVKQKRKAYVKKARGVKTKVDVDA